MKYIAKTSTDITADILVLYLVILDHEIYIISKITIIISCITNSENLTNSKPFDKID
jgi:hypothetical protein